MAELSAGYIISQSFRTYFKHFGLVAKYALSLTGMFAIYFIASVTFLGSEFLNTADETVSPPLAVTILMLSLRFVLALGSILLIIALIRALRRAYFAQTQETMTNELHTARTLLWPYIYTSALLALLQLIPAIIMISSVFYFLTYPTAGKLGLTLLTYFVSAAAIIWLGVRYSLVIPAIAIDGVRGIAALKTSSGIIKGRWWQMFWWTLAYTIVLSLIVSVISLLSLTPVGFFAGINFQGSWFLSSIVVLVLSGFFLPIGFIPLVIIYENLKNSPVLAK